MRIVCRRGAEDSLNLTPLIDVMFNLLIFFLVATSFQRLQRELQVDLPKSKAAGQVAIDIQPIAVTVDREGKVTMAEREVTIEELPGLLREAVAAARKPRVFVRGDAKSYHEHIVAVLGACQEAGITDVSLATEE
ncbi:MAG: biopolymer transporter ExbD [bacterium]|nr:biopolymer transporter ExbD [bacterium]